MSISLKTINDRLSKIKITKLYNGYQFPTDISNGFSANIKLSESWRNFQILLFISSTQDISGIASKWFPIRQCSFVLTDVFINDKTIPWSLIESIEPTSNRGEGILVQAIDNINLKLIIHTSIDQTSSGDRIDGVYGLKLYYSFSYNIIYKATAHLFNIFPFVKKGGVNKYVCKSL